MRKFSKKVKLLSSGVISASLLLASASSFAQNAEPLLMEGKETLYQRVLSTPSCTLHQKADLSDQGKVVPAFTQYYVYNRDETNNSIQVGANSTGKISGYLSNSCAVEWKQQLAMMFTNNANRSRALIFDDETALDSYIDAQDSVATYTKALSDVLAKKNVEHVISIEPEEYVDYTKQFYLLPILNSVETMFSDGAYTYKHEIASVVKQDAKQEKAQEQAQSQPSENSQAASIVGFKSAVIFVIDSSISMQPYIDRTRQAINSIYKSIEESDLGDSVHFGIVSFRADVKKVPGLEYTARMYLKPGEATNAKDFNQKVQSLEQAKVSSAQFDEDSYAGINLALQDINWNDYGGRYIVLITDAGAIDGTDKQSSTGLDANALRLEASHYGAAIYTLHLLTKSGAKNHKKAQAQYEVLSFNDVLNKPLYYPVNAGSVKEFGLMIDSLASTLTEQVKQATLGEMAAGSSLSAKDKSAQKPQDAVVEDSKRLGLAMQLAYLGRIKNTRSPEFMKGWISDHDMIDHNRVVCTPVVLVNRNQLSDLYTLVDGVLKSGIAGQLSSDDMFSQLQALAAQMGRDPNQLDRSKSIAELGIMNELLDDLPYKSRIATLTVDDWYNLGSQEQENLIRYLENTLNYLSMCSSDNDRFIKLNEEADDLDAVYPIPLDALP